MNRTGKLLFEAICASPGDETLHLVVADWLEEEGNQSDRAEAIRIQVRRRSLDDFDPEAWVLDTRLKRLLAAHEAERKSTRLTLDGISLGDWPLTTTASTISPQALLEFEDTIFTSGPISQLDVRVSTIKQGDPIPDAPQLITRCKYLDRLRSLQICGMAPPGTVGVHVLARCPALAKLKSLDLSHCQHEDRLLEYLARCPAWPSLEKLNLQRNSFETAGMRALAGAPILASLRSLDLYGSMLEADGLRALLRSPYLHRLQSLNLSENGLSSRVMKQLTEYPWQRLEHLDLSSNNLTAVGIRHLAGSGRLATLRSLDLGGNHDVDDDGVKALARSSHLGALCDLDLGWWKISASGVKTLGRAPWIGQLRRLQLCGFRGGVAGLKALADVPLTGLRFFEMCYAELTNESLAPLLAAPWISHLTHLNLHNNELGAEGARTLAESSVLDNLVELKVDHNKIPHDAASALRERFGERVDLTGSWVQ